MARNSGNVLFLILIAVALFAALSYVVVHSSRISGSTLSDEQVRLGAASISQYVVLLRKEVMELMITNKCTVENLDWRNDYWKRLDGTPSEGIQHMPVTPKDGCAVFSDYGGPVYSNADFSKYAEPTYESTSPTWKVKAGHATIDWVNRKNEGSEENDIAIVIYGMDHEVCSYLLNPKTRPKGIIEQYDSMPGANFPAPTTWTAPDDIIDEPESLAGDYFAQFNALQTGPSCYLGAIIVSQ